jgi:hypothetical protein
MLPITPPVLAQIKVLLSTAAFTPVLTGGSWIGDPPEGAAVQRPYLIWKPVSEALLRYTQPGKGRYDECSIDATMVYDDYTICNNLLGQLDNLIKTLQDNAPVQIGQPGQGLQLIYARGEHFRQAQELQIWELTRTYAFRVGQPR